MKGVITVYKNFTLFCLLNFVTGVAHANQMQEVKIFCESLDNALPSFADDEKTKVKGEVKIIICEGKPVKIFSIDKSENNFYSALGKLINSCQITPTSAQVDNSQYNPIPLVKEGYFLSSFAIENTYAKGKYLLFSPIKCN